jgi:hypothetical protein
MVVLSMLVWYHRWRWANSGKRLRLAGETRGRTITAGADRTRR